MELKKNQEILLTIEDFTREGEGLGKYQGFPLFVKDTVIGDKAKVSVTKLKKNYGYARLVEILEPSPDRVTPPCPVARQCGGCKIQQLSYEKQKEFKWNQVANCLKRIGGFDGIEAKMEPIYGMEHPWRYRNKAQYPIGLDKDGSIIAGFYVGRTHTIVPNTDCLIQAEVNKDILEIILRYLRKNHIRPYDEKSHTGLVRHVLTRVGFVTGEIMVCLVLNGKKEQLKNSAALVEQLRQIPGMTSIMVNTNKEKTNRILGASCETLWGRDYIEDYIGDVRYQIGPLSFFQVNPVQTERLYGTALEFAGLTGEETVWDLYCGIGTISLFLARRAGRVYGVEIVPQAIRDAKNNAAINDISNARFYVGKAEEVLPGMYEKEGVQADVIVVDPPRKGCEQVVLETMVKMQPERIVYVSCDPATLARDVKYLRGNGYELDRVKAVDMFPHTVHVETVVLMSKVKE